MTVVNWSRDGAVGIVTIDRPSAGNSVTTDVLAGLREAFDELRDSATAIVLRTAGDDVFSVGADLDTVGDLSAKEYARFQADGHRTLDVIQNSSAVVVAAVDGPAIGGGTEFVCAVDLAVATTDASFALPEATIGLVPGGGATQRLPRLVGRRMAMEMLTTGEGISARSAEAAGLVNQVVTDDATGAAMDMATSVAENPAMAIAEIKSLVRTAMGTDLETGLDREGARSTTVYDSGNARSQIEQFVGNDAADTG
jgi:enoyl-CoA hydratase